MGNSAPVIIRKSFARTSAPVVQARPTAEVLAEKSSRTSAWSVLFRQPSLRETLLKAITPSKAADVIHQIADQYAGKIKQRLLEAFSNMQSQVKVSQVANLIERGATDKEIFSALGLDQADAHLGSSIDALNNTAQAAGVETVTQAAGGISGLPKIQVMFDQNSPGMIDYLRSRAGALITTISSDTLANIRTVLANTTESGEGTPMDAARQLRDSIGLTNRQVSSLNNYRYFLENGDPRAYARSIGGQAERIIGAGFRDNTMTPTKIGGLVDAYRNRMLQSRAQIVADTESFSAANHAAHEGWQQIAAGFGSDPSQFKRFWVATNDGHTRQAHRDLPFQNEDGVGLDEPFESELGPIMYPGDPSADPSNVINCRCRVVVRFVGVPQGFLPPMVQGRSILPYGDQ